MFDLPKTSEIRKPLHKKLIYEKYAAELSGNKKHGDETCQGFCQSTGR